MSRSEKRPGEWDFDGACIPDVSHYHCRTFSVGIFQWLPKRSGRGLKRGKVVQRVRGLASDPEEVFALARAICDRLNGGGES